MQIKGCHPLSCYQIIWKRGHDMQGCDLGLYQTAGDAGKGLRLNRHWWLQLFQKPSHEDEGEEKRPEHSDLRGDLWPGIQLTPSGINWGSPFCGLHFSIRLSMLGSAWKTSAGNFPSSSKLASLKLQAHGSYLSARAPSRITHYRCLSWSCWNIPPFGMSFKAFLPYWNACC